MYVCVAVGCVAVGVCSGVLIRDRPMYVFLNVCVFKDMGGCV